MIQAEQTVGKHSVREPRHSCREITHTARSQPLSTHPQEKKSGLKQTLFSVSLEVELS